MSAMAMEKWNVPNVVEDGLNVMSAMVMEKSMV
jgi:hypothetical protein